MNFNKKGERNNVRCKEKLHFRLNNSGKFKKRLFNFKISCEIFIFEVRCFKELEHRIARFYFQ